jgi:DNA-binding transcriptional MerR regulator
METPMETPMETVTIGGLADRAGVHIETIRFYERRQLMPAPRRTRSGYRMYDEHDLWRLEFIRRAKLLGFTLAEIGELFGADNERPPEAVLDAAHAKLAAVEEQMRALAEQRCQLRRLVEVCRHGDGEACSALMIDAGVEE